MAFDSKEIIGKIGLLRQNMYSSYSKRSVYLNEEHSMLLPCEVDEYMPTKDGGTRHTTFFISKPTHFENDACLILNVLQSKNAWSNTYWFKILTSGNVYYIADKYIDIIENSGGLISD
jgi:hypothetical protein